MKHKSLYFIVHKLLCFLSSVLDVPLNYFLEDLKLNDSEEKLKEKDLEILKLNNKILELEKEILKLKLENEVLKHT